MKNAKIFGLSIFDLGKSLKLTKMQFHKKIDLFNFTSFFAWTFLNFLACCEIASARSSITPIKYFAFPPPIVNTWN